MSTIARTVVYSSTAWAVPSARANSTVGTPARRSVFASPPPVALPALGVGLNHVFDNGNPLLADVLAEDLTAALRAKLLAPRRGQTGTVPAAEAED